MTLLLPSINTAFRSSAFFLKADYTLEKKSSIAYSWIKNSTRILIGLDRKNRKKNGIKSAKVCGYIVSGFNLRSIAS